MTEQEAKECLTHLEWLAEDIQKHLNIGYLADLDLCREALEKQIPKKVLPLADEWWDYQCPTCGCKFALSADYDYCPACGQRLE